MIAHLLGNPLSMSILQSKPKLALVKESIFLDLPAVALRESIDEPALVNVGIATVLSIKVLQNPAESVEVLCIDQHLAFVDEIVLLPYLHQLPLQFVWVVNHRLLFGIFQEVICLYLEVSLLPTFRFCEKAVRNRPRQKFKQLILVLPKVFVDKVQLGVHLWLCGI